MIQREDHGAVTVLRMQRGKANAFDVELVAALHEHLDALAEGPDYRAIVLTGTGSIFSAGVDLFRVVRGGKAYVDDFVPAFIRTFTMLFALPSPVIAAINGHAIAGGCVLASACDFRIMVDGEGTIGVPELRVQVPFPTIALEILRFASARAHLQELVYLGRTYLPQEAYERGLIDELVTKDELLPRAIEIAHRLQSIPRETFGLTKNQVRQPTMDRVQGVAADQDARVLDRWRSPDTLSAIQRYLDERFG
jgi:enoyl-CoA hydratase/carnithine racemase